MCKPMYSTNSECENLLTYTDEQDSQSKASNKKGTIFWLIRLMIDLPCLEKTHYKASLEDDDLVICKNEDLSSYKTICFKTIDLNIDDTHNSEDSLGKFDFNK